MKKELSEKTMTNVALLYLRRHSASRQGLVRVLENKVRRHLREFGGELEPARALIAQVVERMVKTGYVNDARMAESKTASLHRQGKSSRAIELKLREKGIGSALAKKSAISTPEQECEAAGMLVKKKRLGVDPERKKKDLGVLLRAGFSFDVAKQALAVETSDSLSPAAVERADTASLAPFAGAGNVIQFPTRGTRKDPELEEAQALVRKKNLGVDPARRQRDFAVLVRAGFKFDIAKRALAP